jgi:hypothetical protein
MGFGYGGNEGIYIFLNLIIAFLQLLKIHKESN